MTNPRPPAKASVRRGAPEMVGYTIGLFIALTAVGLGLGWAGAIATLTYRWLLFGVFGAPH